MLFSRSLNSKLRDLDCDTTASVAATSLALAKDPTRTHHLREAMPIQYAADPLDHPPSDRSCRRTNAAMNKMMADMTIKPSGDVDRDFVDDDGPASSGRDRHGENPELEIRPQRTSFAALAQQIVATQQQEIGRDAASLLGEQPPPSVASPVKPQPEAASDSQQTLRRISWILPMRDRIIRRTQHEPEGT